MTRLATPHYFTNQFALIIRDDFHMWLTPFTPGKDHVIHITLNDVTTIAMIRIWVGMALVFSSDWLFINISELQQI